MPTILERPHQGGGIYIDLLRDRPTFAVEIATINHLWAWIEHHCADLLVYMHGGQARTTMAIYHGIANFQMKLNALQNAAKAALPEQQNKQFIKIANEVRTVAGRRNIVAHSLWAENGEFPDGIIRLPHSYELFLNKRQVELWRLSDFVEIRRELEAQNEIVSEFVRRISHLRASK